MDNLYENTKNELVLMITDLRAKIKKLEQENVALHIENVNLTELNKYLKYRNLEHTWKIYNES